MSFIFTDTEQNLRHIVKMGWQWGGRVGSETEKSLYNKYDCAPMERIQETAQLFPFVLRN